MSCSALGCSFGKTAGSAYKYVETGLNNVSNATQFYSGSNLMSFNDVAFGKNKRTKRSKKSRTKRSKRSRTKKFRSKRSRTKK